jgi:hypothetical protein
MHLAAASKNKKENATSEYLVKLWKGAILYASGCTYWLILFVSASSSGACLIIIVLFNSRN